VAITGTASANIYARNAEPCSWCRSPANPGSALKWKEKALWLVNEPFACNKVNHETKKLTFRYKSWVNRKTKEKVYSEMTLDIYEFMARMLYYLPDKHRKAIRYYGIYAHGIMKKLDQIKRKTWAKAIENSFDIDPELCPDCGTKMIESAVFSYRADREWRKLWRTHLLFGGYFRLKRGP
jgi:hypothetical protein